MTIPVRVCLECGSDLTVDLTVPGDGWCDVCAHRRHHVHSTVTVIRGERPLNTSPATGAYARSADDDPGMSASPHSHPIPVADTGVTGWALEGHFEHRHPIHPWKADGPVVVVTGYPEWEQS